MNFSLIQMETMIMPSSDECKFEENQIFVIATKCPSYQMDHTQGKDLRKCDVNLLGIFAASDNLHE